MSDKVWFITGTSSGFGRALAEAALGRGLRVVATARNTATIADLGVHWPQTAHILELDVTQPDQIERAVHEAVKVFGRIDVVINNAGYGLIGAVEECSEAAIRRNFEVNFFGALNVIRGVLPHLRSRKSGFIVNVSAAAAISNYPGFGIYGASKCALEGLSEALMAEVRAFGVRVMIVEPGPFRTDFISRSLELAPVKAIEYEASVGKFGKFIQGLDGKQPGDPHGAARVIIDALESEKPPLRLVLGRYAVDKSRRTLAQREAELKAWEEPGAGADVAQAKELR